LPNRALQIDLLNEDDLLRLNHAALKILICMGDLDNRLWWI